jgi:cellobionic acid phosphorylase
LFNTGTVSWVYRCLVEGLFGLRGQDDGLRIAPQLPAAWPSARVVRTFRGAEFVVEMVREAGLDQTRITVDSKPLQGAVIHDIEPGRRYQVSVHLPA